jgi:hypothetical protein
MKNDQKGFPRAKLQDLDPASAGHFVSLIRGSRTCPLTLVLGSGVSASAGLPIWLDLLKRICGSFFYQWELDIQREVGTAGTPPSRLSIVFPEEFFWSEEAKKIADEFGSGDPLLVAQQVKNCVRDEDWEYLLRKVLYGHDISDSRVITKSRLLESIAEYSARSNNLRAIVNYNYDDVIEHYLKESEVGYTIMWEGRHKDFRGSVPVFYPHGYLSSKG